MYYVYFYFSRPVYSSTFEASRQQDPFITMSAVCAREISISRVVPVTVPVE